MVAGKEKGAKGAAKSKQAKDEKSADDTFEPIKIDARLANTAVLMLESPEEEVLQKACESIFKFCEKSDTNKLLIHELGATPKLFALLSHEDRVIQRNATMAFGLMSCHPEIRKYLRKTINCVDKMIALLSPDYNSLVNEYAAMCLKMMCEDYGTKSLVASSPGALTSLVAMLASNDADAVFNALGTIDRLMDDYHSRRLVKDTKGIESLLRLIKYDYPQVQELAFSALAKITQTAENREMLRELGGLEKLVEFYSSSDQKDMHISCLNVLSNCLEDNQCLDLIQQTGGLNKILAYCQESSEDPESAQINAAAARVIARSARKAENRKILSEQFVEKVLIYLLMSDNDETKAAAAQAISVMVESVFSQDAIRNYEGIEILIRLGQSENAKVRENVCLALSNLTNKNTNNRRHLLNNQGVEVIMNLVKDEKDTTKAYACTCLTNMAADELVREEVSQFAFGSSIIAPLSSTDTFTQSKACLTIAAYAVDNFIRIDLKNSGVMPYILQLIKSNNDEVRFNSCWALTCCSVDYGIATEFCKHGAIETLRDINQSSQRKSTFTETALNKLLEVNLSAKYALKNYLDAVDSINDGFYDMGPMRPNGKFYSLDELCQLPVNDKRPIIFVYAPEEKHAEVTISKVEPPTKSKSSMAKGPSQASLKANKVADAESRAAKDSKTSKGSKKIVQIDKKGSSEELNKSSMSSTGGDDKNQIHQAIFELYKPNLDKDLRAYIEQARSLYLTQTPREQAMSLAKFVSDKMGGVVAREEVNTFGYELLINETKYEIKSNIVPIGRIRLGTYYHRALLFKVLADKLQLKVTLERGDYNKAWNTVALKDADSSYPPKKFIVDLMHEPGKLMLPTSIDAVQYVKF